MLGWTLPAARKITFGCGQGIREQGYQRTGFLLRQPTLQHCKGELKIAVFAPMLREAQNLLIIRAENPKWGWLQADLASLHPGSSLLSKP